MATPHAGPVSVSLNPKHKKRLRAVQDQIEQALDDDALPARSEAIQVAILSFKAEPEEIRRLVQINRRLNGRRKSK
jgi:hypothetical protein